jgi:lipopolysaccharide export system protein LptA
MFLVMIQTFLLFSQEGKKVRDTLLVQNDTIKVDTIVTKPKKTSKGTIDAKVTYSAAGYKKVDVINKIVVLVQNAVVNYGEIEIKADSILINMAANTLFAIGRRDTTGKVIGKPVFKEGTQEINADQITYNFKTKRAVATNIITKQDAGLLHSQFTKLLDDGTSNIAKSTYSTCDADTPHFYINLPRAKIYPGKKVISGPGNLVLEGIPLPLFLPFGYFPVQTKRAASGILIPRIGQENTRGYSLTDGGYYFAINNYFDLLVKGNIYSNGSWMVTTATDYLRRYRYSGNFQFSYANNIAGHQGLDDFSQSKNYRIGWTYNQDTKAHPGSRFSASVNMSSSGFDKNNSYIVQEHVNTTRQSSISYSKSWDGTPFNFSASMNHSQNMVSKSVFLDLPKASFNMGRIYPLKSLGSSGTSKWWQELQFSYSASLDNQINTYDTLLFTRQVWKNIKNGFQHVAPLSLLIRPFRNFSITPSVTYTGVGYTQKIVRTWDAVNSVEVRDTLKGAFYGQSLSPAISAGFTPQIFGEYKFTDPNSRLQIIRHVMKPSIGFSFVPSLAGLSSKMYRQVQTVANPLSPKTEYSIFDGNIFGTPSLPSKSGNISLSLVNIVEAKVYARNDTTGKPKKIKLIDNFGISTSYNVFADSMRWAPIAMQFRTTLANNINVSANSSFSLYGLNSKGSTIGTYEFAQNGKIMRLTNFGTSLDFSLSELLKGKKDQNKGAASATNALAQGATGKETTNKSNDLSQQNSGAGQRDEYGYPIFNVPWTMNLSYRLDYSKPALKSSITQALILTGNASITKKMSMTYTTGYDFTGKQITMTQIGITRDLHCWEMNFNWVPNGTMKMWNFTIRVKASVLADLKYERRKDFHDTY